jgi:uncharacterized protein (UPF0276 family)
MTRDVVTTPSLGLGWRPETAGVALAREDLAFVEVIAESVAPDRELLPAPLVALMRRGVEVIPHGLQLSLGGAERPSPARVARLAGAADTLGASMVSEHLAFVRAGDRGVGHLLPVPRTWGMADILVENIRIAQDLLPVPLAVEPVASVFEWPDAELTEGDFVAEVVERSGALLLLDLANLYVNGRNFGFDAREQLDRLPLERLAYVHVAGGRIVGDVHLDTHADEVWREVLTLAAELRARHPHVRVMLERDDHFGTDEALHAELDLVAAACGRQPANTQRTGAGMSPSGSMFVHRFDEGGGGRSQERTHAVR